MPYIYSRGRRCAVLNLESNMATFNFSANAVDFGNFEGADQAAAQEAFASDANYTSWAAMVEQAEEFGGNTVEIREVMENGRLSSMLEAV